jgi:hypothetical protein
MKKIVRWRDTLQAASFLPVSNGGFSARRWSLSNIGPADSISNL